MNLIPIKTPKIVKKLFSSYVWDFKTKEKILYLTFDDGPTPEITEWTLDLLKKYNAKATFFCIGNNIAKNPNIFQKIINGGHAIGNHTYNHPRGWYTKTSEYIQEVKKTQGIIDASIINRTSHIPNLFRPPYGQITNTQGKLIRNLNYKIIMWDVLAFDWMDTISEEQCLNNVVSKATAGSIVVFHDSIKASSRMQYALPRVIEYFSEKGFEFRRIPV